MNGMEVAESLGDRIAYQLNALWLVLPLDSVANNIKVVPEADLLAAHGS